MNATNNTPFDLLTILFIALKLMGYIEWSWFWVLSPIWVQTLLIIAIALLRHK